VRFECKVAYQHGEDSLLRINRTSSEAITGKINLKRNEENTLISIKANPFPKHIHGPSRKVSIWLYPEYSLAE